MTERKDCGLPKTPKGKTERIFRHLEDNGFHPKDVVYKNGYFIFDHGKDMVVHFHIKECKGWLFGIWWDLEKENQLEFFTQYEKDIDKFKPTASIFEQEVVFDKDFQVELKYYLLPMLKFIKKHPYQAWYIDGHFTYRPWECVSGFRAFIEYTRYSLKYYIKYPKITKKINKKWLKIVAEICEDLLPDYEIRDENVKGITCYPRYMIICKNNSGKGGHFDIDLKTELDKRLFRKTEKFDNYLKKLAKKGYYPSEVDPFDGHLSYFVKGKK